jgi:hypothetical protein
MSHITEPVRTGGIRTGWGAFASDKKRDLNSHYATVAAIKQTEIATAARIEKKLEAEAMNLHSTTVYPSLGSTVPPSIYRSLNFKAKVEESIANEKAAYLARSNKKKEEEALNHYVASFAVTHKAKPLQILRVQEEEEEDQEDQEYSESPSYLDESEGEFNAELISDRRKGDKSNW